MTFNQWLHDYAGKEIKDFEEFTAAWKEQEEQEKKLKEQKKPCRMNLDWYFSCLEDLQRRS